MMRCHVICCDVRLGTSLLSGRHVHGHDVDTGRAREAGHIQQFKALGVKCSDHVCTTHSTGSSTKTSRGVPSKREPTAAV